MPPPTRPIADIRRERGRVEARLRLHAGAAAGSTGELSARLVDLLLELGATSLGARERTPAGSDSTLAEEGHQAVLRAVGLLHNPPEWFAVPNDARWRYHVVLHTTLADAHAARGDTHAASDVLADAAVACLRECAHLKAQGRAHDSIVPAKHALELLEKKKTLDDAHAPRRASRQRDLQLTVAASRYAMLAPDTPGGAWGDDTDSPPLTSTPVPVQVFNRTAVAAPVHTPSTPLQQRSGPLRPHSAPVLAAGRGAGACLAPTPPAAAPGGRGQGAPARRGSRPVPPLAGGRECFNVAASPTVANVAAPPVHPHAAPPTPPAAATIVAATAPSGYEVSAAEVLQRFWRRCRARRERGARMRVYRGCTGERVAREALDITEVLFGLGRGEFSPGRASPERARVPPTDRAALAIQCAWRRWAAHRLAATRRQGYYHHVAVRIFNEDCAGGRWGAATPTAQLTEDGACLPPASAAPTPTLRSAAATPLPSTAPHQPWYTRWNAAVKIQSAYRMHVARAATEARRKEYLQHLTVKIVTETQANVLHAERSAAATRIQAAWRRCTAVDVIARMASQYDGYVMCRIKQEEHNKDDPLPPNVHCRQLEHVAAMIKAWWRRAASKRGGRRREAAAVRIQSQWRGHSGRVAVRSWRRERAAGGVQSWWRRRYAARRRWMAARRIQMQWRCHVARDALQRRRVRYAEYFDARRQAETEEAVRAEHAAAVIQGAYKRHRRASQVASEALAAPVIQRAWRCASARAERHRRARACAVYQRDMALRDNINHRPPSRIAIAAACTIQRAWRCYLAAAIVDRRLAQYEGYMLGQVHKEEREKDAPLPPNLQRRTEERAAGTIQALWRRLAAKVKKKASPLPSPPQTPPEMMLSPETVGRWSGAMSPAHVSTTGARRHGAAKCIQCAWRLRTARRVAAAMRGQYRRFLAIKNVVEMRWDVASPREEREALRIQLAFRAYQARIVLRTRRRQYLRFLYMKQQVEGQSRATSVRFVPAPSEIDDASPVREREREREREGRRAASGDGAPSVCVLLTPCGEFRSQSSARSGRMRSLDESRVSTLSAMSNESSRSTAKDHAGEPESLSTSSPRRMSLVVSEATIRRCTGPSSVRVTAAVVLQSFCRMLRAQRHVGLRLAQYAGYLACQVNHEAAIAAAEALPPNVQQRREEHAADTVKAGWKHAKARRQKRDQHSAALPQVNPDDAPAASCIQRAWRSHTARRARHARTAAITEHLERMNNAEDTNDDHAVCTIQRAWRCYLAAAIVDRRLAQYEGYLLGQVHKEERERDAPLPPNLQRRTEERAAGTIQALWRRLVVKVKKKEGCGADDVAAGRIQRAWRGFAARRERRVRAAACAEYLARMREGGVPCATRAEAAPVVQRAWRCHAARSARTARAAAVADYLKGEDTPTAAHEPSRAAAIVIQRAWRRAAAERAEAAARYLNAMDVGTGSDAPALLGQTHASTRAEDAAMAIQRAWRGARARAELRARSEACAAYVRAMDEPTADAVDPSRVAAAGTVQRAWRGCAARHERRRRADALSKHLRTTIGGGGPSARTASAPVSPSKRAVSFEPPPTQSASTPAEAACVVQRAWRSAHARTQRRNRTLALRDHLMATAAAESSQPSPAPAFLSLSKAACTIQRAWRCYLAAAIVDRRLAQYEGYLLGQVHKEEREKNAPLPPNLQRRTEERAAGTIQALWRRLAAKVKKKSGRATRAPEVIIQSVWRCRMSRRAHAKRRAAYDAYLVRQVTTESNFKFTKAACTIQRAWRCYLAAAIVDRRLAQYEGYLLGQVHKEERERDAPLPPNLQRRTEERAAGTIQALWRRLAAKVKKKERAGIADAVVRIQCVWRQLAARRERRKRAAAKAALDAELEAEEEAARQATATHTIQSAWRTVLARRAHRARTINRCKSTGDAVCTIQRAWRCYLAVAVVDRRLAQYEGYMLGQVHKEERERDAPLPPNLQRRTEERAAGTIQALWRRLAAKVKKSRAKVDMTDAGREPEPVAGPREDAVVAARPGTSRGREDRSPEAPALLKRPSTSRGRVVSVGDAAEAGREALPQRPGTSRGRVVDGMVLSDNDLGILSSDGSTCGDLEYTTASGASRPGTSRGRIVRGDDWQAESSQANPGGLQRPQTSRGRIQRTQDLIGVHTPTTEGVDPRAADVQGVSETMSFETRERASPQPPPATAPQSPSPVAVPTAGPEPTASPADADSPSSTVTPVERAFMRARAVDDAADVRERYLESENRTRAARAYNRRRYRALVRRTWTDEQRREWAATHIQACYRRHCTRWLRENRRVLYDEYTTGRVGWEGRRADEVLRDCNSWAEDCEALKLQMSGVHNPHYSSSWETHLWERHQRGEVTLKQYLETVDRVVRTTTPRLQMWMESEDNSPRRARARVMEQRGVPPLDVAVPTRVACGAPCGAVTTGAVPSDPHFNVGLVLAEGLPLASPRRRRIETAQSVADRSAFAALRKRAERPRQLTAAVARARGGDGGEGDAPDALGAVPPSWATSTDVRAPMTPPRDTPDGRLRMAWDASGAAVTAGAVFTNNNTTVGKTTDGCLVVFSSTVLKGATFRLAWTLEVDSASGSAPGVLVGVVPYGHGTGRFSMLYRASDGCLRKPAHRAALGYAPRAGAGAAMLLEVDRERGATLSRDGEVIFTRTPEDLISDNFGAVDAGGFLACCILNGPPAGTVTLRSAPSPERAAAATRIQQAYRALRARRRRTRVTAAYREYMKQLHAWELAQIDQTAMPTPEEYVVATS